MKFQAPLLTNFPGIFWDSAKEKPAEQTTWEEQAVRIPARKQEGFQIACNSAPLPAGQLVAARLEGRLCVSATRARGVYSFGINLRGSCSITTGRGSIFDGTVALISPAAPFKGAAENFDALFVDIGETAVARALGTSFQPPPAVRPLPRRRAADLRKIAVAVCREIQTVPACLQPGFMRNIQNLLAFEMASSLLALCPELHEPVHMIGRHKVADLCEWASLDRPDPLAIGDLAAHCGIGIRALEKNFRRHLGTTPLDFLRNLRLDKARRLLKDGASHWSVTGAALEAGFPNLGRFAAFYRRRFGEFPRDTVQKRESRSA